MPESALTQKLIREGLKRPELVASADALEHIAVQCLGTDSPITVQLSIAISLKRIADALEHAA